MQQEKQSRGASPRPCSALSPPCCATQGKAGQLKPEGRWLKLILPVIGQYNTNTIQYKPGLDHLSKLYHLCQLKQCSASPACLMLCLMMLLEWHWHQGHEMQVFRCLSCPSSPWHPSQHSLPCIPTAQQSPSRSELEGLQSWLLLSAGTQLSFRHVI